MYIGICACIHTHAFSCKQVGAAREALGERSGVHQMGCPEAPEILHNQEEGDTSGFIHHQTLGCQGQSAQRVTDARTKMPCFASTIVS